MNLENDILIDNFLKGNLSKQQVIDFQKKLESDKDFKANFELEKQLWQSQNNDSWSFISESNTEHKDFKRLLNNEEIIHLKTTLKQIDSDFKTNKKPRKNLFFYLAAASIALFLGFQFFFKQSQSNQELYKEYMTYSDLPSLVSRGNDTNNLAKAQNLFENKKYNEALSIFQSEAKDFDGNANILIYKGTSEIELDKFVAAVGTFNRLINSNSIDAEKGYWYKALLFVKSNRDKEAVRILNMIIAKSLYKHEAATELLKDLN